MATIARVTTWSSGQILTASALNGEFDNIVNTWNNHDSGSSSWTRLLASNSSSVPLVINNSTGTQNIANFQDNGTNVLTIADGGTTTATANGGSNKGLIANNGTSTGNIFEAQDNGTAVLTVADGGGVTLTGTLTIGAFTATSAAAAPPVANTIYKDNIVKGWVTFNQTGTQAIVDSFNVTSIADNGAGDTTVTWETDFANANYAVVCTTRRDTASADGSFVSLKNVASNPAVGTVRVQAETLAGTNEDAELVSVIAIGDQ